ncbi:HNH endonuclease [Lactococcus cremoris]|uniref:HNH endonuclease n=2 Tax=Streptococcaceae TaxID=1300 RepID=UPI0027E393CF|nr:MULTISPECIES: HNH endonuclease [Lactococcus]
MLINSLVGKQGIETTSLIEVIEFATLSCYYILLQVVQWAAFYCWRNYMSPYKDKRWRSKRDTALRRDKYECRNCKRFGITTTATVVHHVWFLRDYPKWWLCLWNLISLCEKCHNKMHNRDSDIPTELGEYWQDKIKPPTSAIKKYF